MKFRKKPVVIEATHFDGSNALSVMRWTQDLGKGADFRFDANALYIQTLEGEMRADPGDWIICGVNGEFYPCKPDIFEKTYEPAAELREREE